MWCPYYLSQWISSKSYWNFGISCIYSFSRDARDAGAFSYTQESLGIFFYPMKFSSQESHKNFQIFFGNLVKIISRVFFTLPSVYVRTYARNEQHYRSQINLVPGLVFNSNWHNRWLSQKHIQVATLLISLFLKIHL